MRCLSICLLATAAFAGRGDDLAAAQAMRLYYGTLSGGTIDEVRNQLVPIIGNTSKKLRASCIRQLNKGFNRKYKKDLAYHTGLVEILAAAGKPGITMLYKRYKGSSNYPELRVVIAQKLGACGNETALSTLLKMVTDKKPDVAAAAVQACASYAKVKEKTRKATAKKLVAYYVKVNSNAAGKERDSVPMRMYLALKLPMNQTLKAFSGGESLDSAEAWDAWLRENITKPWH